MKDKINKICTELNDGKIAVVQATEQLFDLYSVSQHRELLSCDCPKCGKEMISEWVKHHHCNKCKEHYTST